MTILKLGIIRSSAIGDAVLASASIRYLQSIDQASQVFFFSKGAPLQLISEFCNPITPIDVAGLERVKDFSSLPNFDLIIDLQRNLRSNRIVSIIGKQQQSVIQKHNKQSGYRGMMVLKSKLVGRMGPASRAVLQSETPQYRGMLETTHKGLEKLKRKHSFNLQQEIESFRPIFELQAKHLSLDIVQSMQGKKILAVAPGASYVAKQAPVSLFTTVLLNLSRTYPNLEFWFLGDQNDRTRSDEIIGILGKEKKSILTQNYCGKLSLEETSVVLSQSLGIYSNDSSLGHIAEAFGKPSSVLFGPTCEGFGFIPHLPASSAFSVNLGCRPCSKHGKARCRYNDYRCYYDINLVQIENTIKGWLDA